MNHNISLAIKETATGRVIQEFRKHRGSLPVHEYAGYDAPKNDMNLFDIVSQIFG